MRAALIPFSFSKTSDTTTFVNASDLAIKPNLKGASGSSKAIESNFDFASAKIEFASIGVLFFK